MSEAFKGVTQVLGNLHGASDRAKKGAFTGLKLAGRNTLNVSNTRVPFEEGDLSRDGAVSDDEATMRVAISYGRNADTRNYAVVQHEAMELNHDAGRTAKFLENATNETRDQNGEIVAASTRREMGT